MNSGITSSLYSISFLTLSQIELCMYIDYKHYNCIVPPMSFSFVYVMLTRVH